MTDKAKPFYTWRTALSESDLPSTARHVALAFSLYLNERTLSGFPGAVRLAKDTGLSERCVREQLGLLVKRGWLALKEQGGLKGEQRRASVYEARTPEPALPMQESHPSSSERAPLQEVPQTPAGGSAQLSSELSKELSSGEKKRRSRIPEDWEPSVALCSWAEHNHPTVDLDLQTLQFKDHHISVGSTFVNPDRAWQKWIRNADQWARPRGRAKALPDPAADEAVQRWRSQKGGRRGTA